MSRAPIIDALQDSSPRAILARNIRALRKARGLTLAALAGLVDRSIGWLSQVERGISTPTLKDLQAFAQQFKVPISLFLGHETRHEHERGRIVRATERHALGTSESGMVEELLSPDLGGSFELKRCEIEPGAGYRQAARGKAEEAGYVVTGILEIEISGTWHRLEAGDSFRFRDEPFRWRNPGTDPAVLIRVVSPPTY